MTAREVLVETARQLRAVAGSKRPVVVDVSEQATAARMLAWLLFDHADEVIAALAPGSVP